jgi:TPR repeat protein
MWMTLAAAQGLNQAASTLGDYFRKSFDLDDIFKSVYWYRKASLGGHETAPIRLCAALARAKKSVFDARNRVLVRNRCGTLLAKRVQLPKRIEFDVCGCCGWRSSNNIAIKRCVQCKAVAYCGKACQTKHWQKGHKIDCGRVDKIRSAMKRFQEALLEQK